MDVTRELKVVENISEELFDSKIYLTREPVIIRDSGVGSCLEKWTVDYLTSNNLPFASRNARIHVSKEQRLNFIEKNFWYKTLPFGELIRRAAGLPKKDGDYFICEGEYYYLRALGDDPRKDVARFEEQFPDLATDFTIPDWLSPQRRRIFSTVLRLASPQLTLWTHYDVMDNILFQVRGRKRAVLFHPDDCEYLYLKGDKSAVLDVDNPDLEKFPDFFKARRYEGILEPGDCIFIPALWFHNMTALDFGIAINVFWKHLEDECYDTKDPYGNKDPVPAQRSMMFLNKALKELDVLPIEYASFYRKQLISKIRDLDTACVNGISS